MRSIDSTTQRQPRPTPLLSTVPEPVGSSGPSAARVDWAACRQALLITPVGVGCEAPKRKEKPGACKVWSRRAVTEGGIEKHNPAQPIRSHGASSITSPYPRAVPSLWVNRIGLRLAVVRGARCWAQGERGGSGQKRTAAGLGGRGGEAWPPATAGTPAVEPRRLGASLEAAAGRPRNRGLVAGRADMCRRGLRRSGRKNKEGLVGSRGDLHWMPITCLGSWPPGAGFEVREGAEIGAGLSQAPAPTATVGARIQEHPGLNIIPRGPERGGTIDILNPPW
ncbi:hypothetical protein NDU88_005036 [Pleurodeles waltl]|uniref:Uncharacterized protein n=1 Tax=Pleurodeles waltl TaxID=8319 RepID=A0AAV7KZJ2_PLEWA|nr:hypothetical protein NDU88_005036 [Pleurodeles waltl]